MKVNLGFMFNFFTPNGLENKIKLFLIKFKFIIASEYSNVHLKFLNFQFYKRFIKHIDYNVNIDYNWLHTKSLEVELLYKQNIFFTI